MIKIIETQQKFLVKLITSNPKCSIEKSGNIVGNLYTASYHHQIMRWKKKRHTRSTYKFRNNLLTSDKQPATPREEFSLLNSAFCARYWFINREKLNKRKNCAHLAVLIFFWMFNALFKKKCTPNGDKMNSESFFLRIYEHWLCSYRSNRKRTKFRRKKCCSVSIHAELMHGGHLIFFFLIYGSHFPCIHNVMRRQGLKKEKLKIHNGIHTVGSNFIPLLLYSSYYILR